MQVFRDAPEDIKKAHGWKPRSQWTPWHLDLLKALVAKYPKGDMSIDWVALMKDPEAKKLPDMEMKKIRSYYWGAITRNRPDILKKRRQDAIDYKRKNRARYRRNQNRRVKMIRDVASEFLRVRPDKGDRVILSPQGEEHFPRMRGKEGVVTRKPKRDQICVKVGKTESYWYAGFWKRKDA
jgi:hypothetical protein